MPGHFVRFLRHWPTYCYSQSGLGVTVWRPGHLSFCADPGVLHQHAWNWFFSTSLSYSRSRYVHYCHTIACCGCALCSEGRASWLPRCERLRTASKDEMIFAFCEHPHPLPPLLWVMCHSEKSWCSCSTWMLALIHSLHSCIRWTFVSVVLDGGRQSWVALLLRLLLHLL